MVTETTFPPVAEFEKVLHRHVIDCWFPRSVDREHGGFLSDFDFRWRSCGPQQKLAEFQTRHTWFAAEASRRYPDDDRLREAHEHGFSYLRNTVWDQEYGGWFHLLERSGTPLQNGTKHTHGDSYAISACVAVYETTGDKAALSLAKEAFQWLDDHARDREHGGYFGCLNRDGTVVRGEIVEAPILFDTLGSPIGCKDINVHSDLLETFTYLYRVWPEAIVADRLVECIDIVCNRMATPTGAHYHFCLPDWKPLPHLTRFGYESQSAHRLLAASQVLGRNEQALMMAPRFIEHMLKYGLDGRLGGIFYAAAGVHPLSVEGGSTIIPRKYWWVQAEALKALLANYLVTRDPRYVRHFNALWRYILEQLVDPAFGGFYMTSLEQLSVWQRRYKRLAPRFPLLKGSIWKDASHEGRMLLYCLSRLTALERAKGVPTRCAEDKLV
jgi:mannobiose 2-epimerase